MDEERWRGQVDSDVRHHWSEIQRAHAENTTLEQRQQVLELKVQMLATKIGLFASLGAFLGGGIISVIVGFFTKH